MKTLQYRVSSVDEALSDLRRVSSVDAIELLDTDDRCIQATVFADAWQIELLGRGDDVVDINMRPADVGAYRRHLELVGARPLGRIGKRRRTYRLGSLHIRLDS